MKIFYTIVIGVLCLVIGLGIGYNTNKISMEEKKSDQEEDVVSSFLAAKKSPLLEDIQARFSGKIAEINNKFLLVKEGDSSFEAKISDKPLRIIKIVFEPDGDKKVEQGLKLEDLKIEDQVRVRCVLEGKEWQLIDVAIEEVTSTNQE
jgi:hypothetical protein